MQKQSLSNKRHSVTNIAGNPPVEGIFVRNYLIYCFFLCIFAYQTKTVTNSYTFLFGCLFTTSVYFGLPSSPSCFSPLSALSQAGPTPQPPHDATLPLGSKFTLKCAEKRPPSQDLTLPQTVLSHRSSIYSTGKHEKSSLEHSTGLPHATQLPQGLSKP